MKKFFSWKIIAILAAAVILGFFDAPGSFQSKVIPSLPETITNTKIHLGLDLQGGSQLDYKVDLRKVPSADRKAIVEGVREVINKRVNGLGVSEPNIYTSEVGDEVHIIVELADITQLTDNDVLTYLKVQKTLDELTSDEKKALSLEKAKATVGKTIQLEFKEKKDSIDPQEKDKIATEANNTLKTILKDPSKFEVTGQEEQLASPEKVKYVTSEYVFKDKITPASIADILTKLKPGEIYSKLADYKGSYIVNELGETQEDTGLIILKLIDEKEEVKNAKEVSTSHILVSYQGASSAGTDITRTEDEAYTRAKEALSKLKDEDKPFDQVAKFYSDDPSNKDTGGKLSAPVTGEGTYVSDFENAALALETDGQISDIVKTEFGYHIIKADKITKDVKETKYKYATISFSTVPDSWKETGLTGKQFVRADVQLDQFYQPYVSIQFNDEGSKLFEEITGRNVGKPVAIFVGGNKISSPRVNEKISGGKAQISGNFSQEEAANLARDLNTGAIPAPVVLAGEYTIGATLGQNALDVGVYAGLLAFIVVAIFMIAIYRMQGVFAALSLIVYAVLLLFSIKASLPMWLSILVAIIVFGFSVYRTINSKDPAGEKVITFILCCFLFFFLAYILSTGVVLTLAGIAGIIMSLGMAVDANVLIFERIREEIKLGRPYGAAVEEGFFRAWSSIRDSNFSTLITCAILFYFGSSTIKGFAFNLTAGVIISMFTAITITKGFMVAYGKTEAHKNLKLLGVNVEKKVPSFKFMKNASKWMAFSGVLSIISIFAILFFGFRPGLDFTGGTLMELKFDKEITKEVIAEDLASMEESINEIIRVNNESENAEVLPLVDLKNVSIVPTETQSFLLKTKYLSTDSHDKIIKNLEEKEGNLTELRFTTVGSVVGDTLKNKAITAVVIAIIAIILYVAFAFRKVPKEVNPWKFGIAAIVALIHDVLITTGLFVLICVVTGTEMDLLFITAILTILGYSVNDTIVVFDRLRENMKMAGKDETLESLTDKSLNQTLGRSINTGMTTLLAILTILIGTFLGGAESIRYFMLTLFIGIALGTYSSIFIATSGLIVWTKWAQNKKTKTE